MQHKYSMIKQQFTICLGSVAITAEVGHVCEGYASEGGPKIHLFGTGAEGQHLAGGGGSCGVFTKLIS